MFAPTHSTIHNPGTGWVGHNKDCLSDTSWLAESQTCRRRADRRTDRRSNRLFYSRARYSVRYTTHVIENVAPSFLWSRFHFARSSSPIRARSLMSLPRQRYIFEAGEQHSKRNTPVCINPFPATENRRALRPCVGRPSIARASSIGHPRDI